MGQHSESQPAATAVVPAPLSLIDTGLIAGAGKAILQLYAHPRIAELNHLICNFDYGGRISTEFNDALSAQGYRFALLKQRFGLDPSPIRAVQRLIRDHKLNLIETHGYKGHLIGYALSRFAGVPWVAVAHGWTSENWKIAVYNALERFLLKRADAAVAVSPPLHETLLALRGEQGTHLVFNAIELQEPTSRVPDPQTLTLGVIGRFSPEKGQDVMIAALPQVLEQNPHVRLKIIGDGQERSALEGQAAQLGIEQHVEFTGWRSDMPEQYYSLDALVLSSRSEGLPFAVLEAMSYGVPVIATRVGAIDAVLTPDATGWIVEPGDEAALARGINTALADLQRLQAVGMAGRRSLHPKFSPDQRAAAMRQIYTEVLQS